MCAYLRAVGFRGLGLELWGKERNGPDPPGRALASLRFALHRLVILCEFLRCSSSWTPRAGFDAGFGPRV